MTYHVVSREGDSIDEPSEARMMELLAELNKDDPEHPDTWLTHESGWTLSVFQSGLVIWQNDQERGEPRHLVSVSREEAFRLWLKLSNGNIAEIESEPWRPGHSPPLTDEEKAALAQEFAQFQLKSDREFYEVLGPERSEVRCRKPGCGRGAIKFSVLCRVHHFESLRQRPCPFTY